MFKKLMIVFLALGFNADIINQPIQDFNWSTSLINTAEAARRWTPRRGRYRCTQGKRYKNVRILGGHFSRAPWNSRYNGWLVEEIMKSPNILKGMGVDKYCGGYASANKNRRIKYWIGFFKKLMEYESGHNPRSWNKICTPSGGVGYNLGLLQLDPRRVRFMRGCGKTALKNPKTNIRCGVGKMERLMRKRGHVVRAGKAYWEPMIVLSKRRRILASACNAMNGKINAGLSPIAKRTKVKRRRARATQRPWGVRRTRVAYRHNTPRVTSRSQKRDRWLDFEMRHISR